MTNFNPNYTFDSFVVDDGNEVAHAVAFSIGFVKIPNPYNPFFLYGKWRSGKTHLLHAIGNAIQGKNTNSKILCLTGEEFISDLRKNTDVWKSETRLFDKFKERYRSYDVVMIDDFCACVSDWMEDTQKQIMRLIDDLVANKKQVIIAAELSFDHFPFMYDHARSTYEGGIILDIVAPKEKLVSVVG